MSAERFAVVDVGSNTIKLTVVERGADGWIRALVETSRPTRLGEGIHARRLREAAIRRTVEGLAAFAQICQQFGVTRIAAVGTSALRDAVNQDDFIARANEAGIPVEAIPGEEEARLSYLAVRRDPQWAAAERLLVMDVGGGSTEVIQGDGRTSEIRHRVSLPLGAVRLTEAALWSDPPSIQQLAEANRLAAQALQELRVPPVPHTAVGVGGTILNLVAMHLELPERDPERIHGHRLTLPNVEALVDRLAQLSVEERKQIVGLDPDRADVILGGAIVIHQFMNHCRLDSIAASCRGLRWGVVFDRFA